MNIDIIEINDRSDEVVNKLTLLWEGSVLSTHKFLSREEVNNIRGFVPDFIRSVHILIVAKYQDKYLGLLGLNGRKVEMLFVHKDERGKGIGKQLLRYGIDKYNIDKLTVNEDNPDAVGFYEYMGFEVYERSEIDEQGNPYPILYMKR